MYTMFIARNASGGYHYSTDDFMKAWEKFETYAEDFPIAHLKGLKDGKWMLLAESEHGLIFPKKGFVLPF